MVGRRATVVLAAGLLLGGGTAVAVGLGTQEPAPVPAPVGGMTAAEPSPPPSSSRSAPPEALPGPSTAPSAAEPVAPSDEPTAEERSAPPERVRIPAIDVDSRLLHLGLNDDGTIEVPAGDDIDRAAWFDGSPRPGDQGPAVIEGHVDSPNGESVFYHLSTLEPGQKVHVERKDGTTVTFEVDRVEAYDKDEFPTRRVYANTEGPELRVITCGGAWDPEAGHYQDNTVVYAHQV
ncbi:class F sortase [Isoptericola halotolerans]|uniref:class F sortase n=1 Tax=Isoptericola halotolerans TaxID=300560 RepID=UPI003890D1EE